MSDTTKPEGTDFKDTKRTFWLIRSGPEKSIAILRDNDDPRPGNTKTYYIPSFPKGNIQGF